MGAVSGCLSAGSSNQIIPKKKNDDKGIYDTRRLLSELITVQTAIVFTDAGSHDEGEAKDSLAYTLRSIAEISGRIGRNNVGGRKNVKDQGALPGITEAPSTLSHSSGQSRFEVRQEHNINPTGTVSVVSIQSR
ncbi:uncharacterized protein [Branchiostoma lanceolatum]|uniref:Hypp5210 protein n=1 Tax=Branchiostoma lanceolatum TaxID=7740 RepID=A0A8K0EYP1_BRALA|nr:Hypp5210 [Branchiostoma lanceolatum]